MVCGLLLLVNKELQSNNIDQQANINTGISKESKVASNKQVTIDSHKSAGDKETDKGKWPRAN